MTSEKATSPTVAKKLIVHSNDCIQGIHTFIVTVWSVTGGKQKAVHMMCRHCLMPIELNEVSKDWVVNREWLKETN